MASNPAEFALPSYLFYANLPPIRLAPTISHFWSLCVEMQFYVGVALLVAYLRRDGLMLIPFGCALVTLLRFVADEPISIVTYFRLDEILAGSTLALIRAGKPGATANRAIAAPHPAVVGALLLASCHPEGGWLAYARPYLAALLVGGTLANASGALARRLAHPWLAYIAAISYALYVIHPLVAHTWLGSGDTLEKYAKRPLLFALTFALAHISTFHFERHFTEIARRLTPRRLPRPSASSQ
jgi:peptidoglycan/LPS O-acetylase OafA/YrhL